MTEGNCKVEVEDIGQGRQLVVLSATKDLKEGRGSQFVEAESLEVLWVCIWVNWICALALYIICLGTILRPLKNYQPTFLLVLRSDKKQIETVHHHFSYVLSLVPMCAMTFAMVYICLRHL